MSEHVKSIITYCSVLMSQSNQSKWLLVVTERCKLRTALSVIMKEVGNMYGGSHVAWCLHIELYDEATTKKGLHYG